MAYKTITTYWDGDAMSDARLDGALALARAHDAHLHLLYLSYDPAIPNYAFDGSAGQVMADVIAEAHEAAKKTAGQLRERLAATGVSADLASHQLTYDRVARTVAQAAHLSDLFVLTPPYGDHAAEQAADIFGGAVLDGAASAFIASPGGASRPDPKRIAIAWNGDREAARSARSALPFLREADVVEIIAVDVEKPEENPCGPIVAWLARHGVSASVAMIESNGRMVSETLRARVQEQDADLLVMGAFGHSRLREYLIGGVTRDLLENPPCALFAAH